ncbi:MAG TPA: prepilin-type N-terminal cleavage/methylation domain-containing protein [Fimbriimonadaceae bacterium]|nr:prepilin-type N-terminal cleavage/methylation domain-containing protein [Fimbriimonadaceae bacterium]
MNAARKKGFTLVEVMVAVVLVGIAVSALSSGLGSLTAAFRRSIENEALDRLANEKFDELVATGDWVTASYGDFTGDRYSDYSWSADTETTTIDGAEYLKVTVSKRGAGSNGSVVAEGLVYRQTVNTTPGVIQ